MTTKNLKVLLLALLSLCFFSCSDDDNNSQGGGNNNKEIKAIVACEGNFTQGSARIDIIFDDNTVENDAFAKRNGGRPLGDVAQSITEIDDKLFITLSNSSKIEVVHKNDLKGIATISSANLKKPQYIAEISDSKAVVSHLEESFLTIIDTKTYTIGATVATKDRVKQMLRVGDRLFVAEDECIEVFTINNDGLSLSATLDYPVASNARLIHAADNNVWALCCAYEKGGKDYSTIRPLKENNAYLVSINPSSLTEAKRISLEGLYPQKFSAKLESNENGTELYIPLWDKYTFVEKDNEGYKWMEISGELGLYKVAIKAEKINTAPLFILSEKAATFYNLALTPLNNIYICDAKDYQQNGAIYEYTETGNKVNEYKTGISPQFILFY